MGRRRDGTYKYRKGGDIGGRRTIQWHEKHTFAVGWPCAESLLDVGSGNGRLNIHLKKYFEKIHCIDPEYSLDERFKYDGVTSQVCTFEEFKTDKKFDMVTFIGCFYLMDDKEKALRKASRLLTPTGKIIIVEGMFHLVGGPKGKRGGFYGFELLNTTRRELGLHIKTGIVDNEDTPGKKSKTALIYLYKK